MLSAQSQEVGAPPGLGRGRPIRVEQAQGILMAALGVLAGWYGYGSR